MKKNTRRLKLTRETLVQLQSSVMEQAAGGASTTMTACDPTSVTDPTTAAAGC